MPLQVEADRQRSLQLLGITCRDACVLRFVEEDGEALAADAATTDPAVAEVLPRLAIAAGRARAEIDRYL